MTVALLEAAGTVLVVALGAALIVRVEQYVSLTKRRSYAAHEDVGYDDSAEDTSDDVRAAECDKNQDDYYCAPDPVGRLGVHFSPEVLLASFDVHVRSLVWGPKEILPYRYKEVKREIEQLSVFYHIATQLSIY